MSMIYFFPTTFIQFLSFLSTLDYFPAIFFYRFELWPWKMEVNTPVENHSKKYGKFWTFYQNFRLPLLLSTSKGLLVTHSVWRKDLGEINVILSGRYMSYIFAFLHVFFCVFLKFSKMHNFSILCALFSAHFWIFPTFFCFSCDFPSFSHFLVHFFSAFFYIFLLF